MTTRMTGSRMPFMVWLSIITSTSDRSGQEDDARADDDERREDAEEDRRLAQAAG